MRIAFLSSAATLPTASGRDYGGEMHDRTVAMLRDALTPIDGTLVEVAWDDPDADWGAFDVALIGTPWDYTERREEFLAALAQIEDQVRLENSLLFTAWNSKKTYMRELSGLGVEAVATVWLDAPSEAAVNSAFDLIGEEELVFKPQVGAGARNQHRLKQADLPRHFDEPMMAQPLVPTVETEGEYSFVFIERTLSHCVQKQAADGDYRVQEEYGGTNTLVSPSKEDRAAAERVMAALEATPLYARVDMVRNPASGRLNLMELELIEPYLFPELAPTLGTQMIEALARRLRA